MPLTHIIKEAAMDLANEGISIADMNKEDQPLVYVNHAFEKITGYDAQDVLGRNCRFLQGEGTDPEVISNIREAIESSESISVEFKNFRKDGLPFWNMLSLSPIKDEAGKVTHYVGVQLDISQLKNAKDDLEQAYNGIEKALRIVSHDLKDTNASIVSMSEMINANIENISNDKLRELLNQILTQATKVDGVITSLQSLLDSKTLGILAEK
jgi:PAS domain S-box-containing protein